MSISEIAIGVKYELPASGTWPESVHVFDTTSAYAIRASLAARRPLLVRGEPGTGKSQLARAAAVALDRKFISEVVNAHTEIQDLWYRFDAVSRLGHAQVLSATRRQQTPAQIDAELDPHKYLSPGILWWAFDWDSAADSVARYQAYRPDPHDPGDLANGVVLLIDEIDKADADLPNGLLETLDNGKFLIPWLDRPIGGDAGRPRPLVVITTNEDRQLPGAFVRRCMVLNLGLPKDKERLTERLMGRGNLHFPGTFDEKVLREAAEQLYKDRQRAEVLGVTPPGQAEYLDMLRVLKELGGGTREQLANLELIRDFALKKHPGMEKPRPDDSAG